MRRSQQFAVLHDPDVGRRPFGEVAVTEQYRLDGPGFHGRLACQDVAQQRDGLDVAVQPAFVRHADDRQAFADGFERGRRERVRHGEHRGGGVFREGVVTLGHAPGDVHVDDLVGPLRVASHQFVDQLRPAGIIHGVGDADLGQAALEALEVVSQPERMALIDRHHFVDAVPEDESAVQDRDAGFGKRHVAAVQVDDLCREIGCFSQGGLLSSGARHERSGPPERHPGRRGCLTVRKAGGRCGHGDPSPVAHAMARASRPSGWSAAGRARVVVPACVVII